MVRRAARSAKHHLFAPDTLKSMAALVIAIGSLIGVRHESGVKNAEAVGGSQAAASIAVFTAIRVDSLTAEILMLRGRVRRLERRAKLSPAEMVGPEIPAGWTPQPPKRKKFLGIF